MVRRAWVLKRLGRLGSMALALVGIGIVGMIARADVLDVRDVPDVIGAPRVAWAAPSVLVERRCDAALAWRTQLTLTDINLSWRAGEGDQLKARPLLQRYLFQAQNEITRYCGE